MRQRGRISVWRLLLPLPLAVLTVAIVGTGAGRVWRSMQIDYTGRGRVTSESPSAPAPESLAPEGLESHSSVRPLYAEPRRGGHAQDLQTPSVTGEPEAAAEVAPAGFSEPEVSSTLEGREHSFGPAPEAATASSEAALTNSEPPPAVASAPRPAPAPTTVLVPAPEPRTAPRVSPPRTSPPLRQAWAEGNVRSVRFDSGYYYGRARSARQLADNLTRSWSEQGVNLVYFYAYNRVYGARYVTRYPGNVMEDFGREDLLGEMIRSAHARGIKVVAWLYGPQHKQIWESHPEWRQKTADGRDYRPDGESYFLCANNPEVMQWWLGLVDDLLTTYPDLDGIDIAESQVDRWGDHACYCDTCSSQFASMHPGESPGGATWRRFRAEGMTRLLLATNRLAHRYGMEAHITTVFTARRDGTLMASQDVRDATGFDLEALLSSPDRPEVIQAELIWQQWAALYDDEVTFTPDWTRRAIRQANAMVRGRARLIAHLEVTDFGCGGLDDSDLGLTVAAAVAATPYGIDIYGTHLLDSTEGAARELQMAWLSFAE